MIFKNKKLFITAAALCMLMSILPARAIELTSTSAIVMDAGSGRVYYEKDADTPLAPASMTKVMTVYLIYESIANGTLTKNTLITADEEDHEASKDPDATNVYLETGERYSVDDLIGAILVPSACAASAMVGKYISGSEAAFAELMTKTAGRLGLDAYYEDASGLSDNNRITARSMAKLVELMIKKYPDVLYYTSKSQITFGGKQYNNTNKMLPGKSMAYPGADGFKTGTTTLAGCCFSSSALNDDIRLISVTMHSASDKYRYRDTKAMLDLGFAEANERYNNLYATDLRVFINGHEAPAFCYTGSSDHLTIIAEDLKDYGFDVHWNGEKMLLSVDYNSEKQATPINMEPYRGYETEKPLLPIIPINTSVQLTYKGNKYTLNDIHTLSGYIAVSADELGDLAKSKIWDGENNILYLEF